MMRRVLVTGAFGAIGAWAVRSLLERGDAVVTYDLGGSRHRLAIALGGADEPDTLAHVQGDVTDLDALERVLDEHAITAVLHLAALQVPFVRADPVLGARVNVVGTVNVLEAVRRRADRIGPLVYASSIAAYGDPPSTLYGVFKRANEHTARRYFEDFGVSSIGLRPHTVYGPGRDQGLTSAPTVAMVAAAAGVPYAVPFSGPLKLQYAPDAGEAFVRAGLVEYEGASVHNLDGPVATVEEILGLIGDPALTAQGDPLPFPSDVDDASFTALVGGVVSRPLADGVADGVERFRALLAAGLVQPPTADRA
jgi:nucleoside-diphosphate-sugar epimerase